MDTQKRVVEEVEALHLALADWLSGRQQWDEHFFAEAFENRLHAAFFNVQPSGKTLTRDDLLNALRNGHGRSPEFDIHIRNVTAQHAPGSDNTIVATYEEYQRGARNSEKAQNARLSTAVFSHSDKTQLVWYAIHETWLPLENHAPENFKF